MELVTAKDIRFYSRKRERHPLPEWAWWNKNATGFCISIDFGFYAVVHNEVNRF